MNKYILLMFALLSVGAIVTARKINTPAYSWKPYEGVAPSDALTAGYSHGKPVYIGQAPVEDKLIPGKIQEYDLNLYYECDEKAWSTSEGVTILCTQQPESYTWIPTSNSKLFRSKKGSLVIGGYERKFQTYIGRVQNNGETVVGKVICGDFYCYALYAVKDGKQVEYHSYEVLARTHGSNSNKEWH